MPRARATTALPKVSLLIPTRNGGRHFELLLEVLARQEGLDGVELVVADSGSRDGTVEAARAAGARLITIPPRDFGHGRTRNAAAESATGGVLVLLVQDALPLGPRAVRDLVAELLADDGLAAVSARHVPRSDADLYAAFVVWNHERALRGGSTRAQVSVDNVCAAIRREAWDELRFADVPFAEDLDFGVRARGRGWRVVRSARVAVAHSHTRPAAYHLRRHVADRLFVAPALGGRHVPRFVDAGAEELLEAAEECLAEIDAIAIPRGEAPLALHLRHTCDALDSRMPSGLVRDLRRAVTRVLRSPEVEEFASAQRHVAGEAARIFAAKAAAAAAGRALGDALRLRPDEALAARLLADV
jgi:GT2 family glycosyltransferase